MDDLLFRKQRPSPFLLAGAILFAILSLVSFVEAVRDPPMIFGEQEVSSPVERAGYRIGAGFLCALLAAAIYPRSEPEG